MDKHMQPLPAQQQFQIMTLILNENQCHKFVHIAKELGLRGGIIMLGKGTVNSVTLNLLGIRSQKKQVINILIEKDKAEKALDYFTKAFQLDEHNHGIAYTTNVAVASQILINKQDTRKAGQETEEERMYKKLTVIVNRGMAEDVMEIARKSGVEGGTIIHGRGTGSEITAKFFGMEIEPEKELVMMLMPSELVDMVADNLFRELKLDTPGNGVLYVEPIADVRGLFDSDKDDQA